MGDIYITTNSSNPSAKYLGTTWSKIEGRFLLGTSGEGTSKQTGGSMSKTIQQGHLPNIKIPVDTFTVTKGTFKIVGSFNNIQTNLNGNPTHSGALYYSNIWSNGYAGGSERIVNLGFDSSRSGATSGSFGTVSTYTNNLGSGWGFDVTPSYYTTHIWLRTS